MAIVDGYATLAEAQAWIGSTITGDEPVIERAVEAASRSIDQFCQRHFYADTGAARVFVACDWRLVRFGAFNDLTSATTVETDEAGDGTFETTWDSSDYQLEPVNTDAAPEARPYTRIRAVGDKVFPRPSGTQIPHRLRITGDWGWPAVPHAVNEACLIQAHRLFTRKNSPQGAENFGEFGPVQIRRLDPDVQMMLTPYRQSVVLVG